MIGHLKTIAFLCGLLLAFRVEAASLKVAPARFIVHDVVPGTLYDIHAETGLRLTVYNDDAVARTWVLSVNRPSARGHWETGYDEIPDAAWCWFDQNVVTVEPNGKAYAHLFLRVPDEERFYNQHWVVTFGVDAQPGGGGLALAADIRAQIETKARGDIAGTPAGLLAMKPSLVAFKDAAPGQAMAAKVQVFNNSGRRRVYTLGPLFGNADIDRKTYLTHGYEVIPDAKWFEYPLELAAEPGAATELGLKLSIPDDAAHFGKKWEELILIRPEEGGAVFLRVQVEMKQKLSVE